VNFNKTQKIKYGGLKTRILIKQK